MNNPLVSKLGGVGITQFADLSMWEPRIGDFIIYNGLFRHWFGVVMGVGKGSVEIVKSVLPVDVFMMGPNKQEAHTKSFDVIDIASSRGGKYAIIQATNGQAPVIFIR